LLRVAPRLALRLAPGLPLCSSLGRRELGVLGERLASRHLTRAGLRPAGQRLATPHGEVDLVLFDGLDLVCCEVKTRRARPEDEPCRLDEPIRRRFGPGQLERNLGAARWLARRVGARGRVDLALVWIDPASGKVRIEHYRDLGARRRFR